MHRQPSTEHRAPSTVNRQPYTILRTTYLIYGCLAMLLLFSCKKEVSAYQLSDEELVRVIVDLHISEAAVQHLSVEMKDSMSRVYYDQIFKIQKVDRGQFETDFFRLKKDPEKLEVIYSKVVPQLKELKNIKRKEKK